MLLVRVLTQSLKIISIVALTTIVVVGSVSFFNYWTDRERSENIGRPVTITITEEDDGGALADKLLDADLINFGFYFETRFRFSGDELRPGTYTLRHGMSVAEIIETVSVPTTDDPEATVAAPGQALQITFIEGERIEQYAQTLVDAGWEGDPQEFIDAAYNPSNPDRWDFLDDLPEGASLEGYLFPNTYDIPSNATPETVIEYLLGGFDAQFTGDMREQASDSGRSIHQVVTLASIVEREAAAEQERVTIAGLYQNRLDAGMPLQADPTIQYVLGTPDEWWPPNLTLEQIDSAFENPYNTYNENVAPELPPGPIANPGVRALQAVLQPEEHEYLYMYAPEGSDTHLFASSLEEHTQNVCSDDPLAPICGGGSGEPNGILLATGLPDRRWLRAG